MRRLLHIPNLLSGLLAASFVLPMAVSAEEVTLALYADGEYNSNILGRSSNEVDSFVTHIGPHLRVRDPYGRFTYDIGYRGDFVWYADAKNLDSWDQYADAQIEYALSQKTTLTAKDSFRDASSIRFSIDEQDDLADTLDGGRDQFIRNVFQANIEHMFTRRFSGQVNISNQLLDYEDNLRNTDSSFMGARGSLSYALSSEDTVGLGAGFTYQSYEASLNTFGSRGRIWDTFLTWVHRFDNDMQFSIQGGPSWITTIGSDKVFAQEFFVIPTATPGIGVVLVDPCTVSSVDVPGAFLESSCTPSASIGTTSPRTTLPLIGADPKDSDLTFFGSASLVKNWENWEFRVSYLRRESGASGDDGTSALDRVLLRVNYDADRLWSFYGSAVWSRRKRIGQSRSIEDFIVTATPTSGPARRVAVLTGVGGRNGSDRNQYSLIFGSKRRLTKHLNAEATFRYRYAARNDQTGGDRDLQYYIFGLRLQYIFDPVRF